MHALRNKVKSRDHLASAVVGGNILVLGGRQPEKSELFKNLGTNELYNPECDRWLKILFKWPITMAADKNNRNEMH